MHRATLNIFMQVLPFKHGATSSKPHSTLWSFLSTSMEPPLNEAIEASLFTDMQVLPYVDRALSTSIEFPLFKHRGNLSNRFKKDKSLSG